jgi:hypothetical protein
MGRIHPNKSDLSQSRPWREVMAFYRHLKPGLWLMKLPLLGPFLQKKLIKDPLFYIQKTCGFLNIKKWILPILRIDT